jgi:hypothetical protein
LKELKAFGGSREQEIDPEPTLCVLGLLELGWILKVLKSLEPRLPTPCFEFLRQMINVPGVERLGLGGKFKVFGEAFVQPEREPRKRCVKVGVCQFMPEVFT